jgi:hypothetical protein
MPQFEGAVIREQGITFAVVALEKRIVDDARSAEQAIAGFGGLFPGMPVVLMACDPWGRAVWYGRRDISRFMAAVPPHAVPWRRYTVN